MENQNGTDLAKAIGRRVAKLRKEKGLTQLEVASRLGVAQSVISSYENGVFRLHGELILQLAEIFGVTPNEFLLDARSESRSNGLKNPRLSRRVQAIDKLPRRDQEALLRTIDAFLTKAS